MRIDFNNNTLIITIHNSKDIHIRDTIEEMERLLCKKLSVDEEYFDDYREIYIDVDDYYEYVTLRRKILDYTPIY